MVDEALGPLLEGASFDEGASITVLDPACGEGAFLLGAFRRLVRWLGARAPVDFDIRRHVVTEQLHGVDLDGDALTRARHALCHAAGAALPLALRCGDSLVEPGPRPSLARQEPWNPFDYRAAFPSAMRRDRPGFDVVVGNPPYVDSEHMVAKRPGLRAYCRTRYRAARGNWDLFCPFIERAVELTRLGGRHAFLVPGQLASADYAAGARSVIAEQLRLDAILDYIEKLKPQCENKAMSYAERKQARERNLAARQNCVTVEQHAPTLGADADLAQKEAAVANAIALLPDDILNFSL